MQKTTKPDARVPAPVPSTPPSTPATQAPGNPLAKARAARPKPPENESKSDRFRRVASKRVGRAVSAIKALEPIGRGAAYEYTTEQAHRVLQYLTDAVASVKAAFAPRTRGAKAAQELIDL